MLNVKANQTETWEKRSVKLETAERVVKTMENTEAEPNWWLISDTLDMMIKQMSVLG